MKFILIATALNLQMTYPDETVCKKALDSVQKNDATAMCIPAGEDQSDAMMQKFLNMVKELQKQVDQKRI